jgi:hypothetical protein
MRAIGLTERSCSVCGTQREGTDRYCASCGYDFETGEALSHDTQTHWEMPAAPAGNGSLRPQVEARPSRPLAAAEPSAPALVLVVGPNPRRFNEPGSPPPPDDLSERVFMIDHSPMLIGREGAGLDIRIHDDPYVSRRHAEIVWMAAGWGIRDLGSTNGTRLNGVAVEGSEVRPLAPDDVIELGFFSELKVRGGS